MSVETKYVEIKTQPWGRMTDITDEVAEKLRQTGLKCGTVTIFIPGATGALSTVEFEPGLEKDVPKALERLIPRDLRYYHHDTWHDDNGPGHVKATILGPDLTVPFLGGKLVLGTWQQIVFIECDTTERERKIVLQFMGQ
ncbi:MAG: YjbQ family protein [Candidatus Altiarchaeales archaeon]|nr:YjbQ family protein [Candidatus Altiarchaeales archaeon]